MGDGDVKDTLITVRIVNRKFATNLRASYICETVEPVVL